MLYLSSAGKVDRLPPLNFIQIRQVADYTAAKSTGFIAVLL
jgi:hypothetical protein